MPCFSFVWIIYSTGHPLCVLFLSFQELAHGYNNDVNILSLKNQTMKKTYFHFIFQGKTWITIPRFPCLQWNLDYCFSRFILWLYFFGTDCLQIMKAHPVGFLWRLNEIMDVCKAYRKTLHLLATLLLYLLSFVLGGASMSTGQV